MQWYLAKIVFRILCGEGQHHPQFDEQLRLVQAVSKEDAFAKAQELGSSGEDRFLNAKNELVRWQFITVSELYCLQGLIDGAEVYSRIEERENADQYIYVLQKKAAAIFSPSHEFLQLA